MLLLGVLGADDERRAAPRAARSGGDARRGRACLRRAPRRPRPGSTFAITAWIAHAVGSTITAASSLMSSGTAWSCDSWATMNDRPAAAGVAAEARLQARLDVAERDALAVPEVAARARGAEGRDAPRDATEHRLDDDTCVVVAVGDDFVPGHEGERDDRVEVARRAAVDGGEVAAADAGETRADAHPIRLRAGRADRCRRAAAGRRARRHPGAPRSRHAPRRSGRACARTAAPSRLSLHDRASRSGRGRRSFATVAWGGPIGRSERGPPADFDHCSTSHPRLRAIVASRTSGFTATGIADRLEHRQVGRRVRVGDRLAELEALGASRSPPSPARVPRPWAARRRARPCTGRRRSRRGARSTTSSNRGSSGFTTRSSAPVISSVRWPSAAVLADPPDRRGERLREDQRAHQLGGVLVELLDRCALVATVEVAEEVAAILPVERRAVSAPRGRSSRSAAADRRGRGAGSPAMRRTRRRSTR